MINTGIASTLFFFPNNANENHWYLFILCNLRQIQKEDGDPFDKLTSYCEIQFILLLDSLPGIEIFDETDFFCEMLRFYITNIKDMNPTKINFNKKNLPLFRVKVPQQTDHISCGYYVLRNMIGLSVSKEQVFQILVKDFTGGDRTCDDYNTYFAKVSPTYNHLKHKITKKNYAIFSRVSRNRVKATN